MEPWVKFRNLCQYYADCVKYSEKSQEYLFPNQLNKQFMIPRLPYGWHLKKDEFVVETDASDAFIRNVLLKSSDEDELFIGYPLSSFISPEGFECLCPIMLFPVNIAVRGPGYTTGMRMQIDRQGISINQDWVDYHVPKRDQKAFYRACEQAEDELGCIDVLLVLDYMRAEFKARINPNVMQFSVRNSEAVDGLLNTAVLFTGTKTTYTKTLLSELRRISTEPDSVLDKTALAYIFREPCLEPTKGDDGNKRIPVSFTKRAMNVGQFEAVEASLNSPIVKVMGPPGTGKSFMSVNLIANEVLAGGSVLFTSKNHKAIHAICDKAPAAIKNEDLPLVAFCTTPSNSTNADWQKAQKSVDERVAKVQNMSNDADVLSQVNSEALDVNLSMYRDAEKYIDRYQQLRRQISRYQKLLAKVDDLISKTSKLDKDSEESTSLLEELDSLLESDKPLTWMQRFFLRLQTLFSVQACTPRWQSLLESVAPHLSNVIISRKTIRKEVKRLLFLLKYRELLKHWEETELGIIKSEESKFNYETLKSLTCQSLAGAGEVVQAAYDEIMALRINGVESTEDVVAECKSSMSKILRTGNLDFLTAIDDEDKYVDALTKFSKFLDIFPAWASTMLSLRRASPCLPGVFSLAIIDEASQCEIPPMIPVLFRAKRAAIVGDPNQFPPVVTLKESRDRAFRRRYHIDTPEYRRYVYRENNVFSVVPGTPFLLDEHFRCADSIAEYFNEEFYEGQLALCCSTGRDGASAVCDIKPGMIWNNCPGGDSAEIEAALEYLKELKRKDYKGTIGVISPLRSLANQFKTIVADNKEHVPSQLDIQSHINTANGFQGGECDVILFLLGLNDDRSRGEDWYITAPENKYIFNVSVSRAKHLFVSFGDKKKVALSGLSYIEKLIPESRPPKKVNIGPGEVRLQQALRNVGIETKAQYPVLNRYLDLAIPEHKIDIEVDGQAWHLDRNGCRKSDDIHRDAQLEAAGWRVVRVWHSQVVNDVVSCIDKVRNAIACQAEGKIRE